MIHTVVHLCLCFFFLFIRFTVWIRFFWRTIKFETRFDTEFPRRKRSSTVGVSHYALSLSCFCRSTKNNNNNSNEENSGFWYQSEKQWKNFSKVNAMLVHIEILVEKQMLLHAKSIQNGLEERRKKWISVCDSCTHDIRMSSSTKCTRLTRTLVHWRIEQTDKKEINDACKRHAIRMFYLQQEEKKDGTKREENKYINKHQVCFVIVAIVEKKTEYFIAVHIRCGTFIRREHKAQQTNITLKNGDNA